MSNVDAKAAVTWLGEKTALVFPGQGSQFVGMGKQLYEKFPSARQVFEQADCILGFKLSDLIFEGPDDELEDTLNAQPAILTVSIAALEALKEHSHAIGHKITPMLVAGHSLGEYTALVAAGTLDFKDALHLVRERGRLMKEAGLARPGGMAAIIGLDRDELASLCAEVSEQSKGIVVVANDNCPGQSVISGDVATLREAMALALERGARRAVQLDISIASHSPLMERAGQQLSELASKMHFREPIVPIVSNLTGKISLSVDELRHNAGEHMIRPVMWTNSVREMIDNGTTTFLEIGPGNAMSGLIRRIKRDVTTVSLADLGVSVGNR